MYIDADFEDSHCCFYSCCTDIKDFKVANVYVHLSCKMTLQCLICVWIIGLSARNFFDLNFILKPMTMTISQSMNIENV